MTTHTHANQAGSSPDGRSPDKATGAVWTAKLEVRRGGFSLDVDLAGGAGVLALVGPNGSGKTTVLRALAGAVPADRAEIQVADRVLHSSSRGIDVPMEQRRIGYVPQGYRLFPHLSVLDNVAFGLSVGPARLARPQRHARATAILEDLGCAALAERSIATLSGGEQQRVALARALVLEPDLLLLDEPLAALDAISRRQVRAFLVEHLARFGHPTVLVTHDVDDVVALDARVAVLEQGSLLQCGDLGSLSRAPVTAFVGAFLDAHLDRTSRGSSR